MRRYAAVTDAVWSRLEEQHGDPAVIDGAWHRGLPPAQVVENVLRVAGYPEAVDRIAELERELHDWRYCRECGSRNVTLDECADCGVTASGGQ
jgi:hypothetical protein